MQPDKMSASSPQPQASSDSPQTRSELQTWVRERLHLAPTHESELLQAIDAVFSRHERLWQESKHEAIQALSAGFAEKMSRVKTEMSAGDAPGRSISHYFEALGGGLADKANPGPKTKPMKFGGLTHQLESLFSPRQRGP